MIFSLYFQIILSLSLSFLLHLFNFKKHFHFFFTLLTTYNNNHKCPNYPVSSKSKLLISLPPRPTIHDMKQLVVTESIGFEGIDEMQMKLADDLPPRPAIHDMKQLMVSESIGFESINEVQMQLVDEYEYDYDYSIIDKDNESDDEYCWRNTSLVVEEGVNGSNNKFPPPLSSLDGNGLPSYILIPVRKNGRLQLNKRIVKRPKTVYADREDGRLRLFLVTDQCYMEDDDEEVEQEEEEMVEENRYEYEYVEDDRVRECNINNNERYRKRCQCRQQMVNHIHGSHGNLLMYGVGIV